MLDDINEQDTSFLECKHKHMMKNGAPLDNVGVLYRLISKGYQTLVPDLISIFIDGMGLFNKF